MKQIRFAEYRTFYFSDLKNISMWSLLMSEMVSHYYMFKKDVIDVLTLRATLLDFIRLPLKFVLYPLILFAVWRVRSKWYDKVDDTEAGVNYYTLYNVPLSTVERSKWISHNYEVNNETD